VVVHEVLIVLVRSFSPFGCRGYGWLLERKNAVKYLYSEGCNG